jgi:transcriptional regulator with XRE-family HTH domain
LAAIAAVRSENLSGISELRRLQKFSLAQLSERSGVNRFRLSSIELGYVTASPEEERALRTALLQLVKERSIKFYGLLREAN